jgi:hypothetical protein
MISVGSGTCVFLEENQLQADRQANVASTKTLNRYSLGLATKAAYHARSLAAAFLAETLRLQNGTDSSKRRQRNRQATTRSNAFEMSIF